MLLSNTLYWLWSVPYCPHNLRLRQLNPRRGNIFLKDKKRVYEEKGWTLHLPLPSLCMGFSLHSFLEEVMSTKDSWASGSHHRAVCNWVPHAAENLEGRKAVSWFLGRVYAVKTLWKCSYKRDHLQSYSKRTWTNFISLGFQSSPTKQKSSDLFQGAMRIQWDTVH